MSARQTTTLTRIWWPLWVGLGAASLLGLLIGLVGSGCGIEEGESRPQEGTWFQVRPPPHAPEAVECWVWVSDGYNTRYGGLTCFQPK